jgi:hypothetical protein
MVTHEFMIKLGIVAPALQSFCIVEFGLDAFSTYVIANTWCSAQDAASMALPGRQRL